MKLLYAMCLAILHGIVPYVPYVVLAGANGAEFGLLMGVLVTWTGALLGSFSVYLVAGYLGKDVVSSYLSKKPFTRKWLEQSLDSFFAVLTARLIPVIPSSGINIVAGISGVNWRAFLLASALGKLPFTVLYVMLGVGLISHEPSKPVVFATLAMLILVPWLWSRYRAKARS